MKTWGIDWATEPRKRGAVLIDWEDRRVLDVWHGQGQVPTDEAVSSLVQEAEAEASTVAVDVPFGWPVDFVRFLGQHALGPVWSAPPPGRDTDWRSDRLARRTTERVLMARRLGRPPLTVAFNLLGATAVSWSVVEADLARQGVAVDRSGLEGVLVETYPAAVVRALEFHNLDASVVALAGEIDFGSHHGVLHKDDHARDALMAAVAARARQAGISGTPDDGDIHLARLEGWIHVPEPGVTLRQLIDP